MTRGNANSLNFDISICNERKTNSVEVSVVQKAHPHKIVFLIDPNSLEKIGIHVSRLARRFKEYGLMMLLKYDN